MDTTNIPQDLIDPNEAAKLLHVSAASVRRWCQDGTLPAFRVQGRWKVSQEEVLAMIRRHDPAGKPRAKTVSELRTEEAEIDRVLRKAKVRR